MSKENNKKIRLDIIIVTINIISILGTIFIYNKLPDKIAMHWNWAGNPDRFESKSMIFLIAFLPMIIYILMKVFPKIDPKKESYKKHAKAYNIFIGYTTLFLLSIHWSTVLYALGYNVDISLVVKIGVGILFLVIGNYMSQIRQNYSFGIKIPWTLANEKVWRKTHRLGGYLYIISGLLFIISIFLKGKIALYLPLGFVILSSIVTFIYSYIIYKKETE
ncbi:putative membrane protein [Gottschalkia purinilytica]|uniref:Putative membrane protein n=1 Tax=Gottschalkia purinilytica TaxID=1503 RepID=A0A0L0W726_GOTPU|nr:SdpI family protein [Gottschalkia purinilytica]KNF07070.1 putative membrane protein [Gottschalkia purinilytica]